ncbi:MAG TPA: septal ring lytic transglycosylase RlpA family protein [Nevskiaceae bacterium]|nr:septal ring lytic transglycosylase RlpA family protein [Nevskiaceae bacterium]
MKARLLALCTLLALAGCANFGPEKSGGGHKPISGPYEMDHDAAPLPESIPPDVANVPDAVPQVEPLSKSGNPETYEALGQTYHVQKSADGFHQRGYASWYGRKFHGHRTASGESYDMFAMTAAHKTLPLPTYVRVHRVGTDRSVIVKVNDRGPFHSRRIIDLSYAAAAKLGIVDDGEALVEIETVVPTLDNAHPVAVASAAPVAIATPAPAAAPAPVAVAPRKPGWLQVAVYTDPINAVTLREDLTTMGIDNIAIRSSVIGDASLHRVLVGPYADPEACADLRARIIARGLAADWVSE